MGLLNDRTLMDTYSLERSTFEWVDKPEFNRLVKESEWDEDPIIDNFGDEYGEPYHPVRVIVGILKGGRRVKTNTVDDQSRDV